MNVNDSDTTRPVRRVGLIDQVAERFRDEIVLGHWPVGQRIPTEPLLVKRFGIGRNTVREAVQSLVQAGLLRREQGRGTFVISDSELDSTLERQLAGGTRRHYLELRLALDSAAASLAATNRTNIDVDLLTDLLSRRRASWSIGDLDLRASTDLDLHNAIVAATHNPLYVTLYSSMLRVFAAHMRDEATKDEEVAHTLHADLVNAIAQQDADRATNAVAAIFATHMN